MASRSVKPHIFGVYISVLLFFKWLWNRLHSNTISIYRMQIYIYMILNGRYTLVAFVQKCIVLFELKTYSNFDIRSPCVFAPSCYNEHKMKLNDHSITAVSMVVCLYVCVCVCMYTYAINAALSIKCAEAFKNTYLMIFAWWMWSYMQIVGLHYIYTLFHDTWPRASQMIRFAVIENSMF